MKETEGSKPQHGETMADHLGIVERRKTDRRKNISPWLGTERRVNQRRKNPHYYKTSR